VTPYFTGISKKPDTGTKYGENTAENQDTEKNTKKIQRKIHDTDKKPRKC